MKKFKAWMHTLWRPLLIFLAVSIVVGCIFGFRLGSLTNGASVNEQQYISSLTSGKQILNDPLFLVHKLPTYVLYKLGFDSLTAFRAVSATIATLAAVSCFFILREWYSIRVAILGTWLFISTAWVLHIGRIATPESSYLLMMPILWTAIWLYKTKLRKSAIFLLCIFSALAFYIPGFGWLIIMMTIWKRNHLKTEIKQTPKWFIFICLLTILLVLAPAIWALLHNFKYIFLSIIGLPTALPWATEVSDNLFNIARFMFWKGPIDPSRWLTSLPLLDAFSVIMLLLGIYSMRYHYKLARIQILASSSLLMAILITAGGMVTISALIPVVYVLVAGGIAFMLQQWMTIFPRNPFAKTTATTLMSVSVLFVSFYHINHYFIAWPQTPDTKKAFSESLRVNR